MKRQKRVIVTLRSLFNVAVVRALNRRWKPLAYGLVRFLTTLTLQQMDHIFTDTNMPPKLPIGRTSVVARPGRIFKAFE